MKNNGSIRNWINTLLLAVCAVSLVIIIILIANLPVCETQNQNNNSSVQNNSALVVDMSTVDTSYGKVKFPADFMSYLDFKENKSGAITECVFSCRIDNEIIELYKIVFGDEKDENPAGYLERDGKKIPVSVVSNEIPVDSLSDDSIDTVQAMSGTYSDVMVSISEWDGFVYE